jgi:hypothetical protein
MSTKNLARTVIEGGRAGYNKWDRRQSHAEVRAEERDYLKEVMIDPEVSDEKEIGSHRPVMKGFTDKLAPMYRWLESQVGRPWSEVRSEVFQKFDTRTTAGRHITFDHLLREVVETDSGFDNRGYMANPNIEIISKRKRYWSFSDYYVDTNGILCKPDIDYRSWRRSRYQSVSEEEYKAAEKWLNNRMVMKSGGKYYWLVPTQDVWMATWFEPHKTYDRYTAHELAYYVLECGNHEEVHTVPYHYMVGTYKIKIQTSGSYWDKIENPYSFRQRGELNIEDVKFFRSLKERIRQDILAYGKGR